MAHDVNQSEKDVAAQVRSALVGTISSERYDLWMPKSTQWEFLDGVLTITFDSDFSCQLAKRMLAKDISSAAKQICGSEVELRYHFVEAPAQESDAAHKKGPRQRALPCGADSKALVAVPFNPARPTDAPQSPPRRHVPHRAPDLQAMPDSAVEARENTELWNTFIHGESNQLAWATAKLVVSDPGRLSPVLLHGPSGSGKSLLAQAVAQQLRVARRMPRVVHLTSEQFTNDFTDGLRGGGLPMFRRKYRDVEALILEDIQFFIGKRSTLTEVKHTLDNLLRLNKQVLFTADRSINDLNSLGSDLVGRIRGGLTSPIFPLDEQTRFSFLQRETQFAGIDAKESVLREIAGRVTGDGRVLSGIVKRLTAVAAFDSGSLDWERCWSAIHDLVQATQPIVRIVDIERVVCDVFGLEENSLQSQSKTRRVSQPRMLAMFLARKYTPAAYKEIGDYFGRRRHSTVISAEKTVESWLGDNTGISLGKGLTIRDAIRHVESQLQVG